MSNTIKQIYKISIIDGCDGYFNHSCEGYFDTEDTNLIDKVKTHLKERMYYKGSFDSFENINKDNFESKICSLNKYFDIETIDIQ